MSDEYLPQLVAAARRYDLVENWATEGALRLAAEAVSENAKAQEILDTDPSWQLDSNGDLP
jgi:aspartate/tyrosine/aromatic aminotransferase